MALLQTFTTHPDQRPSLVVFQSSSAQTVLPVLRQFISSTLESKGNSRRILVFSFLYSPVHLVTAHDDLEVYNWIGNIPGYSVTYFHPGKQLLSTIDQTLENTSSPLHVVIDSIDTLLSDIGSLSETYKCLQDVYSRISSRPGSSLILHGRQAETGLLSLVAESSFSASLLHLKGHPAVVLKHLAAEYLTPPPPISPEAKFWGIFLPLSQRHREVDQLVFGTDGEGSSNPTEMVIEVLTRGIPGKKRNVEREIEGWSTSLGPCEWHSLECLKSIWSKQPKGEPAVAADPTQNLSFNLTLTASQQEARAQVPLPYAHEDKPVPGVIFYDPDSADDIDDDDPDEDLDI